MVYELHNCNFDATLIIRYILYLINIKDSAQNLMFETCLVPYLY